MGLEVAPPEESQKPNRDIPPDTPDRLAKRGALLKPTEMDLVTTALGTTLHILQSNDE